MALHAPRPPLAAVSQTGLSAPHAGEHLEAPLSVPASRPPAPSITGALPSEPPLPAPSLPAPPASPAAPLCPPLPAEASAFELVPAAPPEPPLPIEPLC